MKNKIRFDDGSYQVEYAPGQWGQFACTACTQWSYPDQGRNAALRAASPKPEDIVKAVNEHDALKAVEKAAAAFLKPFIDMDDNAGSNMGDLEDALKRLAAIRSKKGAAK